MKRLLSLAFLVAVLLAFTAISALAEPKCPSHPDAGCWVQMQEEWEWTYETGDAGHIIYDGPYYCNECGDLIGFHSTKGSHRFSGYNGGVCSVCGYQRQDRAAYERQALSVESDLDLRSGVAMYQGDVYNGINGSPRGFQLSIGTSYRILAHDYTDRALWVQVCKGIETSNPLGWVKAENLSVNTSSIPQPDPWVIGHSCKVKGDHSKNLRLGPGDYPVVGTFKKDKFYKIYAVAVGTDGKTWYKVSENKDEWVSASVVEVY